MLSDEVLGCVATHKSLEGVKKAYTESLGWHLESLLADGDEIPEVLQREYELNSLRLCSYFLTE